MISLVILASVAGLRRWVQGTPVLDSGVNVLSYSFRPQASHLDSRSPAVDSPKAPREEPVGPETKAIGAIASEDDLVQAAGRLDEDSSVYVAQIKTPKQLLYVVEPGDRLDKISMKFYRTHHRHRDILLANPGLDPRRMTPGLTIVIPDLKAPLPKTQQVSFSMPVGGKRVYQVRAGDVLGVISERELGSVKYVPKILEMNPGLKAGTLKVGQALNLPVGVMASSH